MNDAMNRDSGPILEGGDDEDPLCCVIQKYRAAFEDYNANAPEDDVAAQLYAELSYRPRRRILMGWDRPARSKAGAIAALQLARDAGNCDDHSVVAPMVDAALAFFEAEN